MQSSQSWNETNLCQHNWVQVNKANSKNNGDATNVLLKMESQSSRAVTQPVFTKVSGNPGEA